MPDPRPDEFVEFAQLLTENAPDGYTPWLFRVEAGSKAPELARGSWKDESARMTVEEAVRWMESGGNVGIAGRPEGPLVNVDIDDEDETTIDDLKPTLIARSRSRTGVHGWYFEAPDADIPNIPTDNAGEVRANWQYVVAPGSYVETDPDDVPDDERGDAGYYTIARADPVNSLRLPELPAVFREETEQDTEQVEVDISEEIGQPDSADDTDRQSALFDIEAADVVRKEGGNATTGDRWTALFHGSETGKNMSLSDEGLLHCWRHEVAHNGLQALVVLSDYRGGCQAVGAGHKRSGAGSSCLSREEGAHIWHAWRYAKRNGYLPDDDPVPYSALLHLCRERELCAVSELPDGPDESLPSFAYDGAIKSIRGHDDLDPGRKTTDEMADDDGGHQTPDRPQQPDEEDVDSDDTDGENGGDAVADLSPQAVGRRAGLGEDGSISDLDDREKAACVWDLIRDTDEVHVRVRRDNGSLWAYDDGVWKPEGQRALRHAARQALGSMNYGANVLSELEAQARSDPAVELEAGDFGVAPGTVAVDNGLLSLPAAAGGDGDAIRPLEPDDHAVSKLPVEYDPDAESEEWRSFVRQVVQREKHDAVREYVGYCLHRGAMPHSKAMLLVGSGSNGKTTFLNVIRALLGEEHTTSKPVHKFDEDNHVADLYGALANIDADLSEGSLSEKGIATFKRLVGGDTVDARKLYEDAFSFKPTAKHLYACNQVPDVSNYVSDHDTAFWRRWIVVEFPNYFPPDARDPELGDRLMAPSVLSAVLNWAIKGWAQLRDQGGFSGIESHEETRQLWQSWGESVDAFIADCVERDVDAERMTTTEAYDRYRAWCRQVGADYVGQRRFTDTLKMEDVEYSDSIRVNGKVRRGYEALGLSDEVPEPEDTSTSAEADESQDGSPGSQSSLTD